MAETIVEAIARVYIPERVRELCEGDWLAGEARKCLTDDNGLAWEHVVEKALEPYEHALTQGAWEEVWRLLAPSLETYITDSIHDALAEALEEYSERYGRHPVRCPDRRDGC